MGAVFVFSFCHALKVTVSPRRKGLHTSGAPIFISAAQGIPLEYLTLEARGTCVCGPMGL